MGRQSGRDQLPETYNALQQGVADAQENPLVSIDSMRSTKCRNI